MSFCTLLKMLWRHRHFVTRERRFYEPLHQLRNFDGINIQLHFMKTQERLCEVHSIMCILLLQLHAMTEIFTSLYNYLPIMNGERVERFCSTYGGCPIAPVWMEHDSLAFSSLVLLTMGASCVCWQICFRCPIVQVPSPRVRTAARFRQSNVVVSWQRRTRQVIRIAGRQDGTRRGLCAVVGAVHERLQLKYHRNSCGRTLHLYTMNWPAAMKHIYVHVK